MNSSSRKLVALDFLKSGKVSLREIIKSLHRIIGSKLPRFLDLFIEAVERRRKEIESAFGRGELREINKRIEEKFRSLWLDFESFKSSEPFKKVLASDSSFLSREYAPGISILLARASAVLYGPNGRKKEERVLDLRPLLGSTEVRDVISRMGETLEHEVLSKVIETTGGEFLVLIDGSLIARELAAVYNLGRIPVEMAIEYANALFQLFELCRERKIPIVGISKDSRAYPLRRMVLFQLLDEELEKISSMIGEEDQIIISTVAGALESDPKVSITTLLELNKKYNGKLRRILEIASEIMMERSDFAVIMSCIEKRGLSEPLLVGPYTSTSRALFLELQARPDDIARRATRNAKDPIKAEKEVRRAIDLILELPAIVTTCCKFSNEDQPVRVDIPAWVFGLDFMFGDFERVHALRTYDCDNSLFSRIMSTLIKGYANPENHNVWLADVDRLVKMSRKAFNDIYEPLLWSRLGWMELHTRGERRVSII